MKTCSICKEPKDATEFNKNKAKKDGLNDICRICSNLRSASYYRANRVAHIAAVKKNRNRYWKGNQTRLLKILKESRCMDCATGDFRVLEFDHRDPATKSRDISAMLRRGCSWKTIEDEIKKCDIVCANCHRIRTYMMFPNYRVRS